MRPLSFHQSITDINLCNSAGEASRRPRIGLLRRTPPCSAGFTTRSYRSKGRMGARNDRKFQHSERENLMSSSSEDSLIKCRESLFAVSVQVFIHGLNTDTCSHTRYEFFHKTSTGFCE